MMKKIVRSPGSATIINAIATGFGSAFGIGLDIRCEAKSISKGICNQLAKLVLQLDFLSNLSYVHQDVCQELPTLHKKYLFFQYILQLQQLRV